MVEFNKYPLLHCRQKFPEASQKLQFPILQLFKIQYWVFFPFTVVLVSENPTLHSVHGPLGHLLQLFTEQ